MKISELLDLILEILYDENIMQSKRLSAPEIIKEVHKKKVEKYTDEQISFGITYLNNEKLASHSDVAAGEQRYSLTAQGIVFNATGGFKKKISSEKRKDNLYLFGQIAIIVAGLYYAEELIREIICWNCK